MCEFFFYIFEVIRVIFEDCLFELSGDIVDCGVILIGGGVFFNGIKEWFIEEIVVFVYVV